MGQRVCFYCFNSFLPWIVGFLCFVFVSDVFLDSSLILSTAWLQNEGLSKL